MICIDLEASGLAAESYPIEIAWACVETDRRDSFLIDPESAPGWTYWDEYAEELHGIEPELLQREGIPVTQACRRLNQALEGEQVISDAFEYDSFWLNRLYQAAGMKPEFRLTGLESVLGGEQLLQYRLIARAQFRRHRAMPDVVDLINAIQAVQNGRPEGS